MVGQPLSASFNVPRWKSMTFLWPDALLSLLAIPVLVAAYFFLLRRRQAATLRLSSLAVVREALDLNYRRHVPPLLLLVGIAALLIAIARPTAAVHVPGREDTVILAMDVSASMQATDVVPSRIVAAQRAAKTFVSSMPSYVRIGVVSFAGTAAIVQMPTLDHANVEGAIDRLQLGPSTNLHSGIALSVAAMFPQSGIELEHFSDERTSPADRPKAESAGPAPVQPGSYPSGAIVLLSDGQRTMGGDPLDAAEMAAQRGVKIYTVGIGTPQGTVISFRGWNIRVRLDEEMLKQVARLTGARYFNVGSADELQTVYAGLATRLVADKRETELTGAFALLAALVVALAAGLSMTWFGVWS
jgi:Ca-activated chloride channel family protein